MTTRAMYNERWLSCTVVVDYVRARGIRTRRKILVVFDIELVPKIEIALEIIVLGQLLEVVVIDLYRTAWPHA